LEIELDSHATYRVLIITELNSGPTDIPIDNSRHITYVTDKNNVIVGKDSNNIEGFGKSLSNTEGTSDKIPSTKLKQNSHSKWMMFSATLSGSMEVPAAGSESRGIALFGAIDNTMYFRIEAKNIHDMIGAHLYLKKQGKNGNVIADLLESGKHASTTQGIIIIKGSITDSSLSGPLEGRPIENLVKLIEENEVYVRISANLDGDLAGSLHLAGKQPSLS